MMLLINSTCFEECSVKSIPPIAEKPAPLIYRTQALLLKGLCTQNQSCTKSPLICTKKSPSCTKSPTAFLRISSLFFVQLFFPHKKSPENRLFWAKPFCPQSCTKKKSGKSLFPWKSYPIQSLNPSGDFFPLFRFTRKYLFRRTGGANS